MALTKKYPLIEQTDPGICTASKLTLSTRIVSGIYRKHLDKHKVTMSQLSILMISGKMKSVSQADLGRILKLERSTVTRDLKRLVNNGYLIKTGTKLRPVIEITDSGAQYLVNIIPDWLAATREAELRLGRSGSEALNLVLRALTK
jgi:DNA-binding MarR family transcriptional regulator